MHFCREDGRCFSSTGGSRKCLQLNTFLIPQTTQDSSQPGCPLRPPIQPPPHPTGVSIWKSHLSPPLLPIATTVVVQAVTLSCLDTGNALLTGLLCPLCLLCFFAQWPDQPPEGVTHSCRCCCSTGGPAAPGVRPSSSSGPISLPSSLLSTQTDLQVHVQPRCLSRHGASPAPCATSPVSPQGHHLSNMSWEQKPPRPALGLISRVFSFLWQL